MSRARDRPLTLATRRKVMRRAVTLLVPALLIVDAGAATLPAARSPLSARVHVEWSERVSKDAGSEMHVEPWLAVNPLDPRHLIAAAMVPERGGSVLYVSHDGGRHWSRSTEHGTGDHTFPDIDPVVEFGPDGTAYFATLADGFSVWRGQDGGGSWVRLGVVPGGTYDRQWIGFDASGGAHHGRMYTAGKVPIRVLGSRARDVVAFSSSDDDGRTFRQARLVLPDPAEGGLNLLSHMVVLPSGTVAAAYQIFPWSQLEHARILDGEIHTLLSRDGETWEGPFIAGPLRAFSNRADESLMIKGLGGGRFAAHPAESDRLHLTWIHEMDGFLQIVLASSADGGRTWSAPVRVNDGGYRANHSNPAIAASPSGALAITWNDRRDDPADHCYRPHVAVSQDGGQSFLPSVPLSITPVCPPRGRWLNGGDTQGLVALPDGSFQALWIGSAEGNGGPLQLWTSRITVRENPS